MKHLILLIDYKNRFGSKHNDYPYRSGMENDKLINYFLNNNYDIEFRNFNEIKFNEVIPEQYFLYTSSEDIGYHYKNYIEDIILSLESFGAKVIPSYKYLRANNNKVFMEILRQQLRLSQNIAPTYFYGCMEEALNDIDKFIYPVVFKLAEGASGRNVALAKTKDELIRIFKQYTRTKNLKEDLKDLIRSFKHKGYKRESLYRKKFIIQSFIPNLLNDWKIYVFYDRYYIFYRPILKHRGFRASGGGYDNYSYGLNAKIPYGIFTYAKSVFDKLEVPHASLDIAFDGTEFHLLEFQCVYFGTAGILNSDEFFTLEDQEWLPNKNNKDIEETYVYSITKFLKSKEL